MNICNNKDRKNIKEIYDYIRIKIIRKLYYMTHKTKIKIKRKYLYEKDYIYANKRANYIIKHTKQKE
jgi:hypothetical protein